MKPINLFEYVGWMAICLFVMMIIVYITFTYILNTRNIFRCTKCKGIFEDPRPRSMMPEKPKRSVSVCHDCFCDELIKDVTLDQEFSYDPYSIKGENNSNV